MKKKTGLFLCALLSAFALISEAQPPANSLNIGDQAPPMQVKKWLKGKPVYDFEKGKVYVVEFWATWCLPCIAGMPHLSELAEKYRDKVTISGISILERKGVSLAKIEQFVDSMGKKMDYNVAAEDSSFMATNWLRASGQRGIPTAFVVDQNGRIAWTGLPKKLDEILPQVITGKWDIAKAAADNKEAKRLTDLDNNFVVNTLNPLVRDSIALMKKINEILTENPGLKYYYKTAHFTIYALVKTNPEKLVEYYKELIAASDDPPFKSVTDAVYRRRNLPPAVYVLAADAYQAQLDRYPWSMNFPATYKSMAELYTLAGDTKKAAELTKMAETHKAEVK